MLEDEGARASPSSWRSKGDVADLGAGGRVQELAGEEKYRRFVVRSRVVPWAMNLLSMDEDLEAGMERVGI